MTATVTLHVWRVPARDVPTALVAGRLLVHRLRRRREVTFAKFLGTASEQFAVTAATPRRWAMLTCWRGAADDNGLGSWSGSWWERHADEHATLVLRPLSTRGTWDGHAPFVTESTSQRRDGRVVVLTRSTLRLQRARRFYRAVPAVAAELRTATGCRSAFGIGESPVLRQGTVSVWDSADTMNEFAYRSARHRAVIAATPREQWYAEELFTRFALVEAHGSIDGGSL
jgi:hypothetical protein